MLLATGQVNFAFAGEVVSELMKGRRKPEAFPRLASLSANQENTRGADSSYQGTSHQACLPK